MKARNPSTGTLDTVYVKALDSMPVGTIVDYDGQAGDIPTGWETYGQNQIKKTSETRALAGNIVNASNNSQTSAYSCKYANEHFGGTLLWSNSNTSSSFNAQDVLTDDSYDCIEIIFCYGTSGDMYSSGKLFKGERTTLTIPYYNSGFYTRTRKITYKNDGNGTCTFEAGYLNATSNNAVCIPFYIIGYKTGLFS